jgi:DNA-binding GntR family transcriptional regulator
VPVTRTVYDRLLSGIALGDYAPGSALDEKKLAGELGVSRTPVREALLRLRLEGLVRVVPRGGIFVAETSIRQIREITEVRLVLEECSGRLAVARCSPQWLAEFQAWLDACSEEWPSLSGRERMQRDLAFHAFLDQAAGNEILTQQLAVLRNQAVLFWGQSAADQYELEPIIDEYREVVDSIAERDAERCVRAMQQHVLEHVARIQSYLRPETVPIRVSLVS